MFLGGYFKPLKGIEQAWCALSLLTVCGGAPLTATKEKLNIEVELSEDDDKLVMELLETDNKFMIKIPLDDCIEESKF